MVFLDQERVIEAYPVVMAAAAAHCVLLRISQTGQRLACVQQFNARPLHLHGIVLTKGCGSRE